MTMTAAAVAASLLAIGVALLVNLLLGLDWQPGAQAPRNFLPKLGLRVSMASTALVLVTVTTGWPAAGLWIALLGFFAPSMVGVNRRRSLEVQRIEAVATWAEMLRDQAAAGADLMQAVQVSAAHAPPVLAQPVARLAIRLRRQPPEEAFADFSREVADPTADLVAAALTIAFTGQARRVSEVLSALAVSAREQASMRLRVERDRARVRTVARATGAVAIGWTVIVYFISGNFFATYSSVTGQLVLLVVGGLFAVGIAGLARLDRLPATPDKSGSHP
jgi:tight adherence protein B